MEGFDLEEVVSEMEALRREGVSKQRLLSISTLMVRLARVSDPRFAKRLRDELALRGLAHFDLVVVDCRRTKMR